MPSRRPVPPRSPLRTAIETRSAPVLLAIGRLPRWVPAIVLAVVLVAGLATSGVIAVACLGLIAVVLSWLAFLSWPALSGSGRALRVAVVALVFFAAVAAF